MYRVYVRELGGKVIGPVSHPPTTAAAMEAFAALVNQTQYDGFSLAAVLVENNVPIAIHRFDDTASDKQYWRDRIGHLPFQTQH